VSAPRIELSAIQNWSCHNCGGCCKQHQIEITTAEREKIEQQGWPTRLAELDGIAPLRTERGWLTPPRTFLNHKPDGSCVFLTDEGFCRIHAEFGEPEKPLACRLYPYTFHPAGGTFRISLRFSCPSVVRNKGRAILKQRADLSPLAAAVIPPGAESLPPPPIADKIRLDWPDFLVVVEAIDQILEQTQQPFLLRMLRAQVVIDLIGQADLENITGPRLRDLLRLLGQAAEAEWPKAPTEAGELSVLAGVYFRQHVAVYARRDTWADLKSGWLGRWRLLRAIIKFTRGQGLVPPLQDGFKPVPFTDLEGSFGGLSPVIDELLTRYVRVKLQGLHFCGRGFYDLNLVDGWSWLALMIPTVLWLARWKAVSQGRRTLSDQDVADALAIADHHHGFSGALAQRAPQAKVRLLAKLGDIPQLMIRYAL
jgi:lysine-N-methylase